MTKEEIEVVLEKHKKWLNHEEGGERANLCNADLSCLDLCNVNLSGADLSNADLCFAYLSDADLSFADLSNADLCYAKLNNADLRFAYLSCTDLSHVELRDANLTAADLSFADLNNADLSHAILCRANLKNTILNYADLSGADLNGTMLSNKERVRLGFIVNKPFIGYKKGANEEIIKLEILKGSVVFCINKNKYRTNRAKVVAINGNKTKGLIAKSMHDNSFVYEVGEIVEVNDFNLQYNIECANGIHFFKTKKEAEDMHFNMGGRK